jgi:protein-S-isoprenylcysteine O-methyltransferase Ste14
MYLNLPTLATAVFVFIGILFSIPVLAKGFSRRGTGVKYEGRFLIQRAPQLVSCLNIAFIIIAFIAYNGLFKSASFVPILVLTNQNPTGIAAVISWVGVAILISGLIFMIGGWYSLGDCFSTDAEVLANQTVKNTGLLKLVMHPAYSGIIQSLLGASLASTSIFCALFTLFLVAPLWLHRAKYEEALLMETLGQSYKEYAQHMKWRRLVPPWFPIGV